MKKLFVLIPLVFFLIAISAFADSRSEFHFPMDKDMVWVYDDGTRESIVAFKELKFKQQLGQLVDELNTHLFVFDNYHNEQLAFFIVGKKVFEWTENNRRLWYDFSANAGDKWEVLW